jgi:hypothetical protein
MILDGAAMMRTALFISRRRRSLLLFLAAFALADSLFAADPILPDLRITPGVYRKNLSKYKICHTKWGLDKRYVTLSMKKKVFITYGIPYSRHSEFEVDHLISRELGGADVVDNLWPESYITQPWNARRKDRLENYLHKLVCRNQITLPEARREILNDWTIAYRKYFGERPLHR